MTWTPERVLERIQAWAAAHNGRPPAYDDWHPGGPGVHPDWVKGVWPSSFICAKRFDGKWNAALRAAGFEPRSQERQPTPVKECPTCEQTFERREDERRHEFMRRRFCSRKCMGRASGGSERMARAVELRRSGRSNGEIAEALGTSNAAIAHLLSRAKRVHGIEIPRGPYGGGRLRVR